MHLAVHTDAPAEAPLQPSRCRAKNRCSYHTTKHMATRQSSNGIWRTQPEMQAVRLQAWLCSDGILSMHAMHRQHPHSLRRPTTCTTGTAHAALIASSYACTSSPLPVAHPPPCTGSKLSRSRASMGAYTRSCTSRAGSHAHTSPSEALASAHIVLPTVLPTLPEGMVPLGGSTASCNAFPPEAPPMLASNACMRPMSAAACSCKHPCTCAWRCSAADRAAPSLSPDTILPADVAAGP